MNISSNSRLAWVAMLSGMTLVGSAWAQVIPNPLLRPNRSQSVPQGQPSSSDPQARGATAAPPRATARSAEGEGLPAERADEKTLAERLSTLYVSAVIGDRAVLRSTESQVVAPLPSSSGGVSGTGGATGSAGGGGGGAAGTVAGLRSQMFVVRNGEVLPFLDRVRLLVRVRDTTVTLFDVTDIPPGNYDPLDLMDRGFPVAFRGSVDSVQSSPPTPSGLLGPGQGLDGAAFERGRNTSRGTGTSDTGNAGGATGTTPGTGNP